MSSGLLATLLTTAATRWSVASTTTDGLPSWSTPVAVTCSPWTRTDELVQDAQGDTRRATVRAIVSSTVVQGDKVALGTSVSATPTAAALEVLRVDFATTPLDAETIYVALLGG